MNKAGSKLRDLNVQLGQLSVILDSKVVFLGKLREFLKAHQKISKNGVSRKVLFRRDKVCQISGL